MTLLDMRGERTERSINSCAICILFLANGFIVDEISVS